MLYHNLVPDEDATWFWRTTKPLLVYFTLVDFGKLTTLTEVHPSARPPPVFLEAAFLFGALL